MSLDPSDIQARVFSSFYKTFTSGGIHKDEAYSLARRGAELLTASDAPLDLDHGGKTFRALVNAFLAEGVDPLEACRMAERGAQLLLALEALPDDRWERLRDCAAKIRAGSE